MSGLSAGMMDREITLKTGVKSQDPDTGEEVIDWDTLDETLWAQWLPAGTREAWQAQQRLASYVDGVFRIYDLETRPTPDGSRIVMGDRTFDVRPYIEIERGIGLEIPVTARGE